MPPSDGSTMGRDSEVVLEMGKGHEMRRRSNGSIEYTPPPEASAAPPEASPPDEEPPNNQELALSSSIPVSADQEDPSKGDNIKRKCKKVVCKYKGEILQVVGAIFMSTYLILIKYIAMNKFQALVVRGVLQTAVYGGIEQFSKGSLRGSLANGWNAGTSTRIYLSSVVFAQSLKLICLFYGFSVVPPGNGMVLLQVSPFFVLLLSLAILKEGLKLKKVFVTFVIIGGSILVIYGAYLNSPVQALGSANATSLFNSSEGVFNQTLTEDDDILKEVLVDVVEAPISVEIGYILVVGAAACSAFGSVGTKMLQGHFSASLISFLVGIASTIMGLVMLLSTHYFEASYCTDWLLVIVIGLLGLGNQYITAKSVYWTTPQRCSIIKQLQVVFSYIYQIIVEPGTTTPMSISGAVLVVLTVITSVFVDDRYFECGCLKAEDEKKKKEDAAADPQPCEKKTDDNKMEKASDGSDKEANNVADGPTFASKFNLGYDISRHI